MLKKRLIPVLLLQNGLLVRSELFKIHQIIGNPLYEVQRFNEWNVDELIYLDITRDGDYDLGRDDHKVKGLSDPLGILDAVAKTCFMPLTWGGRIRSVDDMRERFSRGADKITINTVAFRTPELITQAAQMFGNQAVVVSIDALKHADGRYEVFVEGGRVATGRTPADWAREAESRGAGEILLQSIDRDGIGQGYDVDLIGEVASAVSIPVIACSGVGRFEDYAAGIEAGASAVAAANIWHFKELTDRQGKRALARAGVDVRISQNRKK
jgi:cyclase